MTEAMADCIVVSHDSWSNNGSFMQNNSSNVQLTTVWWLSKTQTLFLPIFSALRYLIVGFETNRLSQHRFQSIWIYSQIFWVFVFFCYANRKHFRRCFSMYALKCAKYDKYFKFKGIFLRIIWALLASKQFIFCHKFSNREKKKENLCIVEYFGCCCWISAAIACVFFFPQRFRCLVTRLLMTMQRCWMRRKAVEHWASLNNPANRIQT